VKLVEKRKKTSAYQRGLSLKSHNESIKSGRRTQNIVHRNGKKISRKKPPIQGRGSLWEFAIGRREILPTKF